MVNNGAHPIRIHTANGIFRNPTLQNAVLADFATVTGTPNGTVVDVGVGGRVTIAGNINAANFYNQANGAMIAIHSVGGKSSASVKANAVVDSGVGQGESRNITCICWSCFLRCIQHFKCTESY